MRRIDNTVAKRVLGNCEMLYIYTNDILLNREHMDCVVECVPSAKRTKLVRVHDNKFMKSTDYNDISAILESLPISVETITLRDIKQPYQWENGMRIESLFSHFKKLKNLNTVCIIMDGYDSSRNIFDYSRIDKDLTLPQIKRIGFGSTDPHTSITFQSLDDASRVFTSMKRKSEPGMERCIFTWIT